MFLVIDSKIKRISADTACSIFYGIHNLPMHTPISVSESFEADISIHSNEEWKKDKIAPTIAQLEDSENEIFRCVQLFQINLANRCGIRKEHLKPKELKQFLANIGNNLPLTPKQLFRLLPDEEIYKHPGTQEEYVWYVAEKLDEFCNHLQEENFTDEVYSYNTAFKWLLNGVGISEAYKEKRDPKLVMTTTGFPTKQRQSGANILARVYGKKAFEKRVREKCRDQLKSGGWSAGFETDGTPDESSEDKVLEADESGCTNDESIQPGNIYVYPDGEADSD